MTKRETRAHSTESAIETLIIGRVVRPHGVRGELVVEPYSELLDSLAAESSVEIADASHTVAGIRRHKGRALLKLSGVEDRDEAERFRGQELAIEVDLSEPLPEGTYYRWQILGLEVVDESGKSLGSITEIIETGANDVYVVSEDAGQLLLPAIEDVILEVDLDLGRMRVSLPAGLERSK